MPTYSYKCTSCGHIMELFHKISEMGLKDCESCNKKESCQITIEAPPVMRMSNYDIRGQWCGDSSKIVNNLKKKNN